MYCVSVKFLGVVAYKHVHVRNHAHDGVNNYYV